MYVIALKSFGNADVAYQERKVYKLDKEIADKYIKEGLMKKATLADLADDKTS